MILDLTDRECAMVLHLVREHIIRVSRKTSSAEAYMVLCELNVLAGKLMEAQAAL